MESNYRYYSRRAAEERHRARVAVTEAAKARHRDLALLFETKATVARTLDRWHIQAGMMPQSSDALQPSVA